MPIYRLLDIRDVEDVIHSVNRDQVQQIAEISEGGSTFTVVTVGGESLYKKSLRLHTILSFESRTNMVGRFEQFNPAPAPPNP